MEMHRAEEKFKSDKSEEFIPSKREEISARESEIETVEELEDYAAKVVSEMEGTEEDFIKRGEQGTEESSASVHLSPEKVEILKKRTGVRERIASLSKEALRYGKKKIMISVLGMAVFANMGIGELNKAQLKETPRGKSRVEKLIKGEEISAGIGGIIKGDKKTAIKLRKEQKRDQQLNRVKRDLVMERAEQIRTDLVDHIKSKDYLDKLKLEFDDVGEAKNIQRWEIENLKEVRIKLFTLGELQGLYYGAAKKEGQTGPFPLVFGTYNRNQHRINASYRDLNLRRIEETLRHEFLHSSKRAGFSKKAKEILGKSFIDQNNNNDDKYFRNTSERLVRKQILDEELEKFGIKKYGEKFADKHYRKMMECYRKGKFSKNANEFIEMTDPKYFRKIFNEIAKNERQKENNRA